MLHIVYGGSASGKSSYAEGLAVSMREGGRLLYIATMYPYKWNTTEIDPETMQRINRHRAMRAKKGFETVECYRDLEGLDVEPGDVLLVECMSNLLANEMYLPRDGVTEADKSMTDSDREIDAKQRTALEGGQAGMLDSEITGGSVGVAQPQISDVSRKIVQEILGLAGRVKDVVLVTNDVFSDGGSLTYDDSTRDYVKNLADINCTLAKQAATVTEVVCGIPVIVKKNHPMGK